MTVNQFPSSLNDILYVSKLFMELQYVVANAIIIQGIFWTWWLLGKLTSQAREPEDFIRCWHRIHTSRPLVELIFKVWSLGP